MTSAPTIRLAIRGIIERCQGDEDCIVEGVQRYCDARLSEGVSFLYALTSELGLRPSEDQRAAFDNDLEAAGGDIGRAIQRSTERLDKRENPMAWKASMASLKVSIVRVLVGLVAEETERYRLNK